MVFEDSKKIMIMKKCSKCGFECEYKKTEKYFHKNKTTKDGLHSWCKKCRKKYYQEQKEQARKNHHKCSLKKNNLTQKEYENIFIEQNGRCVICGSEFEKPPDKDHNHKTGKFRGLLCNRCNKVLGSVKDNIFILFTMIKYLQNNKIK